MPQIPTRENLGQIRVNGRATPAQINPNVAYDIGRAGAAMDRAMSEVAAAFSGLGAKAQAQEDATWLANAKIKTLEADDAHRRDTELNAGEDGTGFEQAPAGLKGSVEEIKKLPGGSAEARSKYDLWSAEQVYETGRWAANSSQKRLRDSTLSRLDTRLTTLQSLASANPERAEEYISAYEEELGGYVGSAITAQDAQERKRQARSSIGFEATAAKAIKKPGDLGKAMKALEGYSRPDTVDTETRGLGRSGYEQPPTPTGLVEPGNIDLDKRKVLRQGNVIKTEESMSIGTDRGEVLIPTVVDGKKLSEKEAIAHFKKTGQHLGIFKTPEDADKYAQALHERQGRFYGAKGDETSASGVSGGTLSFLRKEEGFTHKAKWDYAQHSIGYGTKAKFPGERISKQEAETRLRAETQKVSDFIDKTITVPLTAQQRTALISFGFNLGTDDIEKLAPDINAGNFDRAADRMLSFNKAGGEKNAGLVARRQREANMLRNAAGAEPAAAPMRESAADLSKLPKVDGSIQPAEIAALEPADRKRLISGMAPALQVEMQDRMEKAAASLAAKGSQSIITEQEIDDSAPMIGAKTAEKWKQALIDEKLKYDVNVEAKGMSRAQREMKLAELVPTGNVEDLAAEERKRFELWGGAFQKIDKQVKADPLRYVKMETESGRQANKLIAAATDGEDGLQQRERAYTTLIRLQRDEGVAEGDIAVLGPQKANEIARKFQEVKSGAGRAEIVKGLRATFGEHTDRVWGELVKAGLPSAYRALTTATEQGQDNLVQAYALEGAMNEAAGKDEDRRGALRKRAGVDKNFDQALTDAVAPFSSALMFSSNDLRVAYRNAVEMNALYYMAVQGKSQSDAVSQAYDDIVGSKTEIYRGVIIPKSVADSSIGADVRSGIYNGYQELLERDKGKIISPLPADPSKDYMYERESYFSLLLSRGQFKANNDGTGAFLLDHTGRKVKTSSDEGGIGELSYTWEELGDSVGLREKRTLGRYTGSNKSR